MQFLSLGVLYEYEHHSTYSRWALIIDPEVVEISNLFAKLEQNNGTLKDALKLKDLIELQASRSSRSKSWNICSGRCTVNGYNYDFKRRVNLEADMFNDSDNEIFMGSYFVGSSESERVDDADTIENLSTTLCKSGVYYFGLDGNQLPNSTDAIFTVTFHGFSSATSNVSPSVGIIPGSVNPSAVGVLVLEVSRTTDQPTWDHQPYKFKYYSNNSSNILAGDSFADEEISVIMDYSKFIETFSNDMKNIIVSLVSTQFVQR